eukprot:gene8058-8921_t
MNCGVTMWPLDVPREHLTSWGVVCVILAPLVVILNAILIRAMVKTRDTKSITSHFIIIMSISDIAIGSLVLPMIFGMVMFDCLRHNCAYQSATQFFAYAVGYTSFFLLIAIAVDRYIRMTLLTKYESVMNKFRMKCAVVAVIFVSMIFAVETVLYLSFPIHMVAISLNVLLIIVIYAVYASMLYRLDKQSVPPSTPPSNARSCEKSRGRSLIRRRRSRRKRDIAVAKTVKILVGTIFVMYMPYNIISPVWLYYKLNTEDGPSLVLNVAVFWSYIVLFLNSIANVFVYAHGNSKIGNYLMSWFRQAGRKQDESTENKSYQETSIISKQEAKKKDLNVKTELIAGAKV